MTTAANRVLIVGAGTMGAGLARLFARNGWETRVLDRSAEALRNCRALLAADPGIGADAMPGFQEDWTGLEATDLMIETVSENVAIKRQVLALAEEHLRRDTPIASNSSGLDPDDISAGMANPERFLIAHFFNPPELIPAVEILAGRRTAPGLAERIAQVLKDLGKRPAILRRNVPGFVSNRIQHAIMRECFHLLEAGVADAAALDDIIRYSIGVRMALNGPFRQRDINGLDTHLNIARYLYEDLAAGSHPPAILERMVEEGRLGRKAGAGFYDWPSAPADSDRQALEAVIAIAMTADDTGGPEGSAAGE